MKLLGQEGPGPAPFCVLAAFRSPSSRLTQRSCVRATGRTTQRFLSVQRSTARALGSERSAQHCYSANVDECVTALSRGGRPTLSPCTSLYPPIGLPPSSPPKPFHCILRNIPKSPSSLTSLPIGPSAFFF